MNLKFDLPKAQSDALALETEESIWEVSEFDGYRELRMTEDPSVAITFSYLEGVQEEILERFETEFVPGYAESLSEVYSGVVPREIFRPEAGKAGFSLILTEPDSGRAMYQLFYL